MKNFNRKYDRIFDNGLIIIRIREMNTRSTFAR